MQLEARQGFEQRRAFLRKGEIGATHLADLIEASRLALGTVAEATLQRGQRPIREREDEV